MSESSEKADELDLEDRRRIVIAILKWLSRERIPRRVAEASIKSGFQPDRKNRYAP
jgi:hypothetical protein